MEKHIRLVPALVGCVALAAGVHAQGDTTPGGEYYIHGIFNPTISDVHKIDLRPQPVDTVLPEKEMTYGVVQAVAKLPLRVDSIAPAKLNVVQANERLYKGYVKAGFGLYSSPLGEVYYDGTRAKKNGYGIHLKHFSSNGGLDDVGPSQYSFNAIDAFYKAILPHHEIKLAADYDRRGVNYYGYRLEAFDTLGLPTPTSGDILQYYNDLGFSAKVKSLFKDDTKIAHEVEVGARYFTDRFGSKETNVKVNADASMEHGDETYGAVLLIDNNAYRAVSDDETIAERRQNGTLVGLTPTVSTTGEKYKVRIGAGIYVDALAKTTFHFYPQAYASYSLFDDILVPYIGVDGQRLRNSFRSVTDENPWVSPAPVLANTSKLYDVYGGLRGALSSRIGFDIRVSGSGWKDKVLYVTDAFRPLGNSFSLVYDRVSVLDVSGDISYDDGSGTRFHGRIDIFNYTMRDQPEAWNLPPYQLTLGARYSLQEKLILKLDALFMGQRKALTPIYGPLTDSSVPTSVETVDLKGFFDLYIGAEYRYTPRLSIFLDLSNLSASKYERWYGYPVQRTLILGGLTYSF